LPSGPRGEEESEILKSNTADGCYLERQKNCDISKTIWSILKKFGLLTHVGLPDLMVLTKIEL